MPFPGCGRSQDVKLASRGVLTSLQSPRANPMFPPRAVAPTLHGRFFSGPTSTLQKKKDFRGTGQGAIIACSQAISDARIVTSAVDMVYKK